MKELDITAKMGRGEDAPEHTVTVEFPENLEELIEKYGEDVVFAQARSAIVVGMQSKIRQMKAPDRKEGVASDDDIVAELEEWTPGNRRPGKSKAEKMRELYAGLDPELRKALLAEMRENLDAPVERKPATKQATKTATKTAPSGNGAQTRPAASKQPQGATRPAQQAQGVKRPAQPAAKTATRPPQRR